MHQCCRRRPGDSSAEAESDCLAIEAGHVAGHVAQSRRTHGGEGGGRHVRGRHPRRGRAGPVPHVAVPAAARGALTLALTLSPVSRTPALTLALLSSV
eukprot:scaffold75127_cov33-Phaeocystis_antarctica.AAC.1